MKRNRFAVDNSPEAGPEGRVLQEVSSETDNEWILLETLGMYTVKSLKHDKLIVDVSYKVDCEDAKIKAKELALEHKLHAQEDPAYAATQYPKDMTRDTLYAEASKHLT